MAITLSNSTVAENTANATVVATLAGVSGTPSLTNDAAGAFTLVDNAGTWELRVANHVLLDYEASVLHTLAIQITDSSGAQSYSISVTDVLGESVTGSSSADDMLGGAEADTISGGAGNDTIDGGEGNNVLSGDADNDEITGGSGNDYIDGGTGDDRMIGDGGDDTYVVDSHDDAVLASIGGGTDTLIFTNGAITNASTLYQVEVGIDNIVIDEAAGVTFLKANGATNTIVGNSFANYIETGTGDDTVYGGDGDDTYVVIDSDVVVLELEADLSTASDGTDLVMSSVDYTLTDDNVENLTLTGLSSINGTGNGAANVITGNGAGNRLDGGADTEVDTLVGGNGNDTYVLNLLEQDVITETTTGGTDTVEIAGDFNLGTQAANVENLTNTDVGVGHTLVGSDTGNRLTGNSGADILDGGLGRDTMIGGDGDDTYFVDQANEGVTEGTGEGNDRIVSSVTYSMETIAPEVEELVLATGLVGTLANINATGNALDNLIVGNEGNNKLDGGSAGADSLFGGDGDDTYVVHDASTEVNELKDDGLGALTDVSSGTDTVQSFVTYTLTDANIENLELLGTDDVDATGNDGDNVLGGNSGDNELDGGLGADTMDGGLGNDTYYVDDAGDVVEESETSTSTDVVFTDVAFTLGKNIEQLWLDDASTAVNLTGNGSANLIVGSDVANLIDGAGGADTMWGGDGDDTYVVDNSGDVALDVDQDGTTASVDTADLVTSSNQDIDLSDTTRFSGIENVTLTNPTLGTALNLNATGDASDNIIIGNDGNNLLDGGTGADSLVGGLGNDTFVLDDTDDTVSGGDGTDTIRVNATYSIAAAADIENLALTGTADIDATGNDSDNSIDGNSGANRIDGGAGSDTMTGGGGDDTYVVDETGDRVIEQASGGFDTVEASASYTLGNEIEGLLLTGTDDINGTGNAENNDIEGNSGANVINGGEGVDTMAGNAGDDTFWVNDALDVVDGGDDVDTVRSGVISLDLTDYTDVENASLSGAKNLNLTGTTGNNVLTGGGGANVLDGNTGADTMYGGGGNDTYVVDSADDVIADAGNGVVAGGVDLVQWTGDTGFTEYTLADNLDNLEMLGADAITGNGNSANNTITGNAEDNVIDGKAGADTMLGGAGDDTYVIDNAGDVADETGETDTADAAVSSATKWTMSAGIENATIADGGTRRDMIGNASDNVITGGDQANLINGGAGDDTLSGGAGNDTFIVDSVDDVVDGGDGTDWVYSSTVSVDISAIASVENIQLTNVNSTTFSDLDAVGNAGANRILGNAGANDIDGGAGNDTMQGGKGNDTYRVANSGDKVLEFLNQGTDEVVATASTGFTAFTLGSNIENLMLSTGMITGTGNTLNNAITGNAEDNVLNGGGGLDTMVGGDGDDTYVINRTDEVITEGSAVGSGTDTVKTTITGYTLGANLENLTLLGLVKEGTGNALANTITGNGAGNLLDGGANVSGVDTMVGGRGNDTYVINDASDVVTELAAQGYDHVRSALTYVLGDNIEVLQLTGTADVNGTGNALANQVLGNSGDNVLSGGAGNDLLNGGAGQDTLIGGAGKDNFRITNSADSDTIQDFSVADDTIQLSKATFAGLGSVGTLAVGAFVSGAGATAADAGDRIIYDSTNGKVFYDADGSGSGTAIEIAQLTGGLALTNADFVIIS